MERSYSPPPECRSSRNTIEQNGLWINNTEPFLDLEDEGYEEQQAELSDALSKAKKAVFEKPSTCGLQYDGNGNFDCSRCFFYFGIV